MSLNTKFMVIGKFIQSVKHTCVWTVFHHIRSSVEFSTGDKSALMKLQIREAQPVHRHRLRERKKHIQGHRAREQRHGA